MKQNDINILQNKIEEYFINEMGTFYEKNGTKTMMGRIFGLLVSRMEPVSLKAIAVRLKVSKPAISTTIKMGLQPEMFKKAYEPDFPREDFYTVGGEFLETMTKPGVLKLKDMQEKFSVAKKMLENSGFDIKKDKELSDLYKRISYTHQAFEIFIEEYEILADKVIVRLSESRKKIYGKN